MKSIFLAAIIFFSGLGKSYSQVSYIDLVKGFTTVTGSWEGTLTYMDYSTGKPYVMPANIEVSGIDLTGNFILRNIYPNEPGANSEDTLKITTDGMYIDNRKVISMSEQNDGKITVITEEEGKDGNDNKAATIRIIYTLGKNEFSRKKEVKFMGESDWIIRHEYKYTVRAEK